VEAEGAAAVSGIKANWHLEAIMDTDDDPRDIMDLGRPIDLSRDAAVIQEELAESLRNESYLWRVPKIRCPTKQETGDPNRPPCATCHMFTANPADPMSRLCRTGRHQAALLTELDLVSTAERQIDTLDAELEAALGAAEAHELAEALLA
jgi:hypothetical protein